MSRETVAVTEDQVESVVHDELQKPVVLSVGGRAVSVRPLPYRWQVLFLKEALGIFEEEAACAETILKEVAYAAEAKAVPMVSFSREIFSTVVAASEKLDRAAAVILASQVEGAKADAQKFIAEQAEWLRDHSRIEEMRALVDAQADKEKLVQAVGNGLPARLEDLLQSLAGANEGEQKNFSLAQALSRLFSKSPATSNGDGGSI